MFELFGPDMPLAAKFFIAFLLVLILVIIPLTIWLNYRYRAAIRKMIIGVSEIIALIAIFVCTFGGALTGLIFAYLRLKVLQPHDETVAFYSVIGLVSGAISGFVVSALSLALLFLLIEIAENSRKTVAFFERVSSRTQS